MTVTLLLIHTWIAPVSFDAAWEERGRADSTREANRAEPLQTLGFDPYWYYSGLAGKSLSVLFFRPFLRLASRRPKGEL